MKFRPFSPKKYRRRVFSQLCMLALQFVLGMLLNLTGSGAKGSGHTFYVVILSLHILNAIGLVEGGIYIAFRAPSRLARRAAIVVSATLVSGVITAITGQDVWSFVMACGFLVSSWLYIMLYIRADRQLPRS